MNSLIAYGKQTPFITSRVDVPKDLSSRVELYISTPEEPNCIWEADTFHTCWSFHSLIAYGKQITFITSRVDVPKDLGSRVELYISTPEQSNCVWEADSFHTDAEVSIICSGDVLTDKKMPVNYIVGMLSCRIKSRCNASQPPSPIAEPLPSELEPWNTSARHLLSETSSINTTPKVRDNNRNERSRTF